MSNPFEVNQKASIAVLGMRINDALDYLEKNDIDSVRDLLLGAHRSIYPNSSHTATPEENAKICADEPTTSPISKIRSLIDEMYMAGYSDEDGKALMSYIRDIHRIVLSTSEKDAIQIHPECLKHHAEKIHKAAGIVDLVKFQLKGMHDEINGEEPDFPVVSTPIQLVTMLSMVDDSLLSQAESIEQMIESF